MRRLGGRAAFGLALLVGSAGGAGAQVPALRIEGGRGAVGATVEVAIRLAGDGGGAAATADLDIAFPDDRLAFDPPLSGSCTVAPRLAATHQVGGSLLEPGLIAFAIFARALEIAPLGDGVLATCRVRILPEAAAGTAHLQVAYAGLGDAAGRELDVAAQGGAIVIGTPACTGDCSGNGIVTVDEMIRGVRIVLAELPRDDCPAFDRGGGTVGVADLVAAVTHVLTGCPS